MSRRLPALLAGLLFATGLAADTARPYALEVIVFARSTPSQSIDEVFPSTAPPMLAEGLDFEFALEAELEGLLPLPSESYVLNNSANRLRRQLGADILFHRRWIHPLLPLSDTTPWFRLTGLGRDGVRLDGMVRWSIDRFIELDADLRVTRPNERFDLDGTPLDAVYVLQEFRKMASKDIHYLDHPAFGVIIAAEPLPEDFPLLQTEPELDAPESEADASPALSGDASAETATSPASLP